MAGYAGPLVQRTWSPPLRAGHPQGDYLLVGAFPLLAPTHHFDPPYLLNAELAHPRQQAVIPVQGLAGACHGTNKETELTLFTICPV